MQQRLLDQSELKKVITLLRKKGCDLEDLYQILCSQFLVDLDDVKKIVQAN